VNEELRRDADLYYSGVQSPQAQPSIGAARPRGFQTREAELTIAQMLGELER
jgi:hypothetical protein